MYYIVLQEIDLGESSWQWQQQQQRPSSVVEISSDGVDSNLMGPAIPPDRWTPSPVVEVPNGHSDNLPVVNVNDIPTVELPQSSYEECEECHFVTDSFQRIMQHDICQHCRPHTIRRNVDELEW